MNIVETEFVLKRLSLDPVNVYPGIEANAEKIFFFKIIFLVPLRECCQWSH